MSWVQRTLRPSVQNTTYLHVTKIYLKELCSTDIQDWNFVTYGQNICRRDSVVNIATRFWLDGQGIESRWG